MANIVAQLGAEIDFRIVTSHHDYQDRTAYPGIALNRWQTVGRAEVFYMNKLSLNLRTIGHITQSTPHQMVYLNSVFSYRFSILPLMARRLGRLGDRPVLVASRGELGAGALGLSRSRKRIYLQLGQRLGLFRGLHWQASSEQEAIEIMAAVGAPASRVHVAPNLADLDLAEADRPDRPAMPPQQELPLSIAFLSRISRKKNLIYALDVIARVRNQLPLPPRFHIYGNVCDPAYWDECRQRIEAHGLQSLVQIHGPLPHQQVRPSLASHDLFLLPTLHENFGHVIIEALAAGTPVLTSDQTPWTDLPAEGAGWVCRLDDPASFDAAVLELARLPWAERQQQRQRARRYAARHATDPTVVERNRRLFLEVAGRG
ncbi:MAG: glycosyltransferase [Cyanobacteriota bacterium]|nr:glycosyltransferase [Cyanobacteriota bacterium]